jgi:hypothetical protein
MLDCLRQAREALIANVKLVELAEDSLEMGSHRRALVAARHTTSVRVKELIEIVSERLGG